MEGRETNHYIAIHSGLNLHHWLFLKVKKIYNVHVYVFLLCLKVINLVIGNYSHFRLIFIYYEIFIYEYSRKIIEFAKSDPFISTKFKVISKQVFK